MSKLLDEDDGAAARDDDADTWKMNIIFGCFHLLSCTKADWFREDDVGAGAFESESQLGESGTNGKRLMLETMLELALRGDIGNFS